jgi:hypothetical protein
MTNNNMGDCADMPPNGAKWNDSSVFLHFFGEVFGI